MEKKTLYRFFEGKASLEDEKQVKRWMEASEANRRIFMQERNAYDALLVNFPRSIRSNRRERINSWYRAGSIAATVLLLIVSTLYLRTLIHENNKQEKYNTLSVPAGQRTHLTLADNTDVWLNANSSFRYPSDFYENERTVYLDGEAFFEVCKNDKRPFLVKTDVGDIRVTGTSFNVEAYSGRGVFETSLFEGSVEIYSNKAKLASLQPNEKGIIADGKISITPISDTDQYLWRDGLIAFSHKRLEEILLSFGKYFDVDIRFDPKQLPQRTYTGKFRSSDGVDYALRILQRSIRFTYERDEVTGIVYIKQPA